MIGNRSDITFEISKLVGKAYVVLFDTCRLKIKFISTVWSPNTDKHINKIEMVQRRALRRVSNQYSSYDNVSATLSNQVCAPSNTFVI